MNNQKTSTTQKKEVVEEKIFAYIDGANLHKGINELGWQLDYRGFRLWLKEKYQVNRAYLFFRYGAEI